MIKTLPLLFVSVALAGSASAAALFNGEFAHNGTNFLPNPYTASTTDLLQGLTPSAQSGNFSQEGSGGTGVLNDGTMPATITRYTVTGNVTTPQPGEQPFPFASFATGGNTGGTSVTYTFLTGVNIGSIVVYGGWQDSGRDQQSYTVFVATAANPSVFSPLITVDYAGGPGTSNPRITKGTITDDASAVLASNIKAIRFDFNATENGYSGYTEIDVNQAIPEPTAAALLGFAGAALALRRRRAC